jgi:hypothetical protein
MDSPGREYSKYVISFIKDTVVVEKSPWNIMSTFSMPVGFGMVKILTTYVLYLCIVHMTK